MDSTTASSNPLSSNGVKSQAAQDRPSSRPRRHRRPKPQTPAFQPTNSPPDEGKKVKKQPVAPGADAEAAGGAIASSFSSPTVHPKPSAPILNAPPRRKKRRGLRPNAVAPAPGIAVPAPASPTATTPESTNVRRGALRKIDQARINRLLRASVDGSNPISMNIPGPSDSQLRVAQDIPPIATPLPHGATSSPFVDKITALTPFRHSQQSAAPLAGKTPTALAGGGSKIKAHPASQKEPDITLTPEEKAARKQEQRRLQKAKRKEDHFNLVIAAANATLTALNKYEMSGAVFGSLACKLYGTFREPKDVDMLILQPPDTPRTAEEIKILIVDSDPRSFYLKLPRDPTAPYRILYYRSSYLRQDCKVDILLPGTMYLPDLFPYSVRRKITTISNIPLVPFSLLLLHKLQGWSDHIVATEEHKRRKHVQDAADVRRLLTMEERLEVVKTAPPWSDPELFCDEFQELTRERVKEYCKAFPKRAEAWELLGFDIEVPEEVSSDLPVPP